MRTQLHIALRYLFAKKKHNVINIISIISAAGIAIGSMALVLILSVYNGFDNSIKEIYESYKADFLITPKVGKTFEVSRGTIEKIKAIPQVNKADYILQENVFIKYGNREAIAQAKGVDESYLTHRHLSGNIVEGEPKFYLGEIKYAVVGEPLAYTLGLRSRFITPIEIYFPDKKSTISITNPLTSLKKEIFRPSATVKMDDQIQENVLYMEISSVRSLTATKENHYTSIEVYLNPNTLIGSKEMQNIQLSLEELLPGCYVKDKQKQNSTLYKMMKAEKFAVYLILFFVIVIISVNIFSSLSMLVTDKKEDIATFLHLGATKELVTKIFHLHGFLISLTGCTIGIFIGTALALIQKEFRIITIPGNYILEAYPIDIHFTDLAITFLGVISIGFIISALPMKKFFKN